MNKFQQDDRARATRNGRLCSAGSFPSSTWAWPHAGGPRASRRSRRPYSPCEEASSVTAQLIEVGCIGPCYLEPLMDIAAFREAAYLLRQCESRQEPSIIFETAPSEGRLCARATPWAISALKRSTTCPDFFDSAHAEKPGPHRIEKLRPSSILRTFTIIWPAMATAALMKALSLSRRGHRRDRRGRVARPRRGRISHREKMADLPKGRTLTRNTIICNADEGDPGAFMNRSLLEGDPHSVLEGMLIAAYAIGAITRIYLHPRRIPPGHQAA